jgi:hypothetical protein
VYYNVLVSVYQAKGVIVYKSESLVTYPSSMKAVLPEKEALFKMASDHGFPVSEDNYDLAQVELDKQMQKIRSIIFNK